MKCLKKLFNVQGRPRPFGVLVDGPTQRAERVDHVGNVLLLRQIVGLENVDFGHAVLDQRVLKAIHVLHHLKVHARRVDLGHDARLKRVHEAAQDDSVFKRVLECFALRELFFEDGLDPMLDFGLLGRVPLA